MGRLRSPQPISTAGEITESTIPLSATAPEQSRAPLAIRWVYPENELATMELALGVLRLGRDADNDVVLSGGATSRHHAEIEGRGSAFSLRDLGSRNGVYVDGVRVNEPVCLVEGSVVRLGEWVGVVMRTASTRGQHLDEVAPGLFGSELLQERVAAAKLGAKSTLNALVLGETGVGKELVAQALHTWSGRGGAFVAVNCAALSDSLLEAELFGHDRGAFTGAERVRKGHVREAEGGTLLLDEVAELSALAQAKLLRVLQEREVTPVGTSTRVAVDVRVLSATHKNLRALVASGAFRQDLFARLEGLVIELPPLRVRREDIFALFARAVENRLGRRPRLSAHFAERLCLYSWPGNVRELLQTAERMCVLYASVAEWRSNELVAAHPGLSASAWAPPESGALPVVRDARPSRRIDRVDLVRALDTSAGNVAEAARALGTSKQTLYKLIARHSIALAGARMRARPPD